MLVIICAFICDDGNYDDDPISVPAAALYVLLVNRY